MFTRSSSWWHLIPCLLRGLVLATGLPPCSLLLALPVWVISQQKQGWPLHSPGENPPLSLIPIELHSKFCLPQSLWFDFPLHLLMCHITFPSGAPLNVWLSALLHCPYVQDTPSNSLSSKLLSILHSLESLWRQCVFIFFYCFLYYKASYTAL